MPIPKVCSVREFLCDQLLLEPVYVENRIQTIFLNGRAVDDLNQAMMAAGSTLALSAAMPGLAGACFRRAGSYSPLRSNISFKHGFSIQDDKTGRVTVKLFNLIVTEAGPAILEKGIYLPVQIILEILKVLSTSTGLKLEFHLNDQPVTAGALCQGLSKESEALLRVCLTDSISLF